MPVLIELSHFLRLFTIAYSLWLLWVILKNEKSAVTKRYSALLLIAVAAFMGTYWKELQSIPILFFPLFILSVGLPFAFYLFARHVFSDEKRPLGNLSYMLGGLYLATVSLYLITFQYHYQLLLDVAFSLSTLLLIMASYEALSNFRSDLINARRIKRVIAIVAITIFGMITLFSFYAYEPLSLPPILIIVAALIHLLSLRIFFPIAISYTGVLSDVGAGPDPANARAFLIDETENDPILKKINTAFILTKKYRIEGMTITKLSHLIHEKEYLVRKAINIKLGFSNFNQFLNHHRIEAAKQMLQENDDVTMQEIAYELGYSSPSAFNRAFKSLAGSTPSFYKQSLQS